MTLKWCLSKAHLTPCQHSEEECGKVERGAAASSPSVKVSISLPSVLKDISQVLLGLYLDLTGWSSSGKASGHPVSLSHEADYLS